jgi:hypothetical protein
MVLRAGVWPSVKVLSHGHPLRLQPHFYVVWPGAPANDEECLMKKVCVFHRLIPVFRDVWRFGMLMALRGTRSATVTPADEASRLMSRLRLSISRGGHAGECFASTHSSGFCD